MKGDVCRADYQSSTAARGNDNGRDADDADVLVNENVPWRPKGPVEYQDNGNALDAVWQHHIGRKHVLVGRAAGVDQNAADAC